MNRMQILLFLWKGGLKVFEIIPQDRKVNILQNNTRYIVYCNVDLNIVNVLLSRVDVSMCHVARHVHLGINNLCNVLSLGYGNIYEESPQGAASGLSRRNFC